MKLTFAAKAPRYVPARYEIEGTVINGIDLGLFVPGSEFVGNDDTHQAGIFGAAWIGDELHVTLSQAAITTDMPWGAASVAPIDAADYDPTARYLVATNPQALSAIERGEAQYTSHDGAITVIRVELEELETQENAE